MRKVFLIPVIIMSINFRLFPQAEISLSCDENWGPGRYNKVTVTINITDYFDFARFTQDFPVGLTVLNDDSGNGDFNWVNNQLNLVWMKFPANKKLIFSYFVKPDNSMKGSFMMTGKISMVLKRTDLRTSLMKEKQVYIEGMNGILPDQMKSDTEKQSVPKVQKKQAIIASGKENEIVFMVQVSVTSKKISESELATMLGLDKGTKARVLPAGKMYKYQAGAFSSYDAAGKLLKEIAGRGFRDAFIVAYRGIEQIPVEKALEYVK